MEALVVLPGGLDQRVGADDVRVQERAGVMQGIVVVRLGRVVDHHVGVGHEPVDQGGVADIALHEAEALLRKARSGIPGCLRTSACPGP